MTNQDFNPLEEGERGESVVIDLNEPEEEKIASGGVPAGAKPPPVPGPGSSPGAPAAPPQAGLEELKQQINAERAERARVTQVAQQIARERDQAMAIAQEAERKGVSTYELYNENQIKATQDQMEALSAQSEQAMQDGDFKRAATFNLKIGRLGGALAVLERDQAVLAQQREAQQPRQQQQQPRQQQQPQQPAAPTDPFERALLGRSEATKGFLRKHPEVVRQDGTLKRVVIDAHDRALDEGYQIDTPGYFEYVEKSLMAQTPRGEGGAGPSVPTVRSQQGYSAPVARNGGPGNSGGGAGGGNFVMTPKMRRLAAEQGVPEKEWAQNYVRLLAEGRITPIS
jgi:hypothetical protein